jgi:hypothetical protein
MDATQYAGSSYLTVEDLADGSRTEEITDVFVGPYEKLVAQFESGAALSLNVTNTKALIKAYGEDTDDWIGKSVELYVGETYYKNEPKKSVLVRAPEPRGELPNNVPPPHDEEPPPYGDEIPF